jgi:DNA-binding MarR family transcriptional regulator
VFRHLIAESARAGLRQLDRLIAAAGQGRDLAARHDRRSRLADTVDALLRVPVLTPKALAARLSIAPQTATALLRELQATGLVREVTGRGSFRAFAI